MCKKLNFLSTFSGMGGDEKNGTRGATKMIGLTKSSNRNLLDIQFNEVGNPIGPNIVEFVSYVCMMIQTIMCIF